MTRSLRTIRRAALAFAAAIACPFVAPAEEPDDAKPAIAFREIEIELPGRPDPVLYGDFTDGPFNDLLIVVNRTVYLYRSDKRLGYASRPSAKAEAPKDAAFLGGAGVGTGEHGGLVFLGPRGMTALPWTGKAFGEPQPVIEAPTVLTPPTNERLGYLDFVARFAERTDPVVLIPTARAIRLYAVTDGAPRSLGHIDVGISIDTRRPPADSLAMPRSVGRYPRAFFGHFTQTDKTQAAVFHRGDLLLYSQGEKGFGGQSVRRLRLTGAEVEGEPPFDVQAATLPLDAVDLDGDGRTDLAVTQVDRGRTLLFLNGPETREAIPLHQSISVPGWTLNQKFVDLDGDGRQELILVRIDKVGILDAIKILLTRRLTIQVQIFRARKTRNAEGKPQTLYPRSPSYRRTIESPIVIAIEKGAANFGLPLVQAIGGDFNGDGLGDMLTTVSDGQIAMYLGDRDGLFDERPARVIDIPNLSRFKTVHRDVADLNGDGLDDITLRFVGFEEKRDRMIVLLSVKTP